ncbi:glycosyltransferase family 4 protein [Chitinimonas sp. BJB300]|uniref:glycosyltransferase family 4 protein n=1 Tax=Chitinimonas sp. BJB300 TaxID=1559339 RepID=UPI000C0E0415|nr:glycosyltransferase family 4 protein [Chitinimonas sp. BJB300]PHV11915.1 glycosyl transferase family 1 [Chitinimonas sp. BJB300]TSJ84459.1 glycosyltransferase [Chitinimonas sp. BJB300]
MQFLFIHQNFPGQFRHLAKTLSQDPKHTVVALGQQQAPGLPGVRLIRYQTKRAPAKTTHRYVLPLEAGILAGQAVAEQLIKHQQQGFNPDVVIAHPGWGESLFVKDIFPHARLIHFCEWFYRADGADIGFDAAYPVTLDDRARIRSKNALHLLALDACDIGIAPTHWQKSRFPQEYQSKIQVIHEGVDTDQAKPDANASFTLPDGRVLTTQDKVVTYVARNLEPYRGFPQFIRALAQLQQQRTDFNTLIVGGNDVSYGSKPKDAPNWREKMLAEVKLDPSRTHFLGKLPYQQYLKVLQISTAHVYLTYPFVLSWSLLEAMSAGCCVIASDTAPVREVIRDGEHGYLTDFFDQTAMVNQLTMALADSSNALSVRLNARNKVADEFPIAMGSNLWVQQLIETKGWS